jgi:hypothetical protein
MPDAKCYLSNKLLDKMMAEGFYKITPKTGKIIVVFDPKLEDGVYDVYSIGSLENDISVCTSKGNKDNKIRWTKYIEKLGACNNFGKINKSFAGKNDNYYTLKTEEKEGRENLPYTEFSEAAKEFDELPKGKVIYRHFYFDIPEEIERKVT